LKVSLFGGPGTLALSQDAVNSGIQMLDSDGSDGNLSFLGTLAQINAALALPGFATYTPTGFPAPPGFPGPATSPGSFSVQIDDGHGGFTNQLLNFTINNDNTGGPDAQNDTITNASGPSGAGWSFDAVNGHYYRLVSNLGSSPQAGDLGEGDMGSGEYHRDERWCLSGNHHESGRAGFHFRALWLVQCPGQRLDRRPDDERQSGWQRSEQHVVIRRILARGTWTTGPEAGTSFIYTNWYPGEPNGGFNTSTAYLEILGPNFSPDHAWNDAPGFDNQRVVLEEWGGPANQIAFRENAGNHVRCCAAARQRHWLESERRQCRRSERSWRYRDTRRQRRRQLHPGGQLLRRRQLRLHHHRRHRLVGRDGVVRCRRDADYFCRLQCPDRAGQRADTGVRQPDALEYVGNARSCHRHVEHAERWRIGGLPGSSNPPGITTGLVFDANHDVIGYNLHGVASLHDYEVALGNIAFNNSSIFEGDTFTLTINDGVQDSAPFTVNVNIDTPSDWYVWTGAGGNPNDWNDGDNWSQGNPPGDGAKIYNRCAPPSFFRHQRTVLRFRCPQCPQRHRESISPAIHHPTS